MECKEVSSQGANGTLLSINRNIVECKVIFPPFTVLATYAVLIETLWNVKYVEHMAESVFFVVLIETLWNVKNELRLIQAFREKRINRNIVECKEALAPAGRIRRESLNRNIVECTAGKSGAEFASLRAVLIETLWNVKEIKKSLEDLQLPCINRNIVECKGIYINDCSISGKRY